MAAIYVSPTGNDAGNGSFGSPFATLNRAAFGAPPGTTIFVRGGVYPLAKTQTVGGGLTVQPYLDEVPVLDGSALPPTSDSLVILHSGSRVQGLTIRNSQKNGVSIWGNSHSLTGCKVQGARGSCVATLGASDILLDGLEVSGASSDRSGLWNPAINATGFHPDGSTWKPSTGVTITRCTVRDCWGEGIALTRSANCALRWNKVIDARSAGIYLDGAVAPEVSDNIVLATAAALLKDGLVMSGIQCANEQLDSVYMLRDGVVRGNLTVGCSRGFYYSSFGAGGGLPGFKVDASNMFLQSKVEPVRVDASAVPFAMVP